MQSPAKKSEHTIWFWIALGTIGVIVAVLLFSGAAQKVAEGAAGWAKGVMTARPIAGVAVFFLFSAVSAMLAFTSSAVLVPPANLVWGRIITFLLLWGGWIAGAIAAYGIGSLARPMLVRLGYEPTLTKYQRFVSKRMKFWAVLLFCIAVPSEVPGYLFGGLHYPFFRFIAAIALAEGVYAFGLIVAGDSLVTARPIRLLITVIVMIVIAAGAGWLFRTLRKRKLVG